MRFVFRVFCDAFMRFSQDDGWAIASHIALSIDVAVPIPDLRDRAAGFFGSPSLAEKCMNWHTILLQTWPQQVRPPIANEIHNVLTPKHRAVSSRISVHSGYLFFVERRSKQSGSGLNRAYDVRDPGPGGCCGLNPSPILALAHSPQRLSDAGPLQRLAVGPRRGPAFENLQKRKPRVGRAPIRRTPSMGI